MKPVGPFSKIMAYGAAFFLAAVILVPAEAASGRAVVRAVRGSAEYSAQGKTGPLRVGQTLRSGATVTTAAQSEVDLFLGVNGPVVRVRENTSLGLEQLQFDGEVVETMLDLKSGQIVGNVKKLAANSRYEIKTANSVAGIRGTAFALNSNGGLVVAAGSFTLATVVNGQVQIIEVNAGQKYVPPAPGELPTQQNNVVEATAEEIAAAEEAAVAATIAAAPDELDDLFLELVALAATRAAQGAADPQASATAAAQAAQAATARLIATANQAANALPPGGARNTAIAAANRASGQAQAIQANSAMTAAAAVAARRAQVEAINQGLSQEATTTAAQQAATTAAQQAGQAVGATPAQIDNAGNIGSNVGNVVVNQPPSTPLTNITPPVTPPVVQPPVTPPVVTPPVTPPFVSPVAGGAAAEGDAAATTTDGQ